MNLSVLLNSSNCLTQNDDPGAELLLTPRSGGSPGEFFNLQTPSSPVTSTDLSKDQTGHKILLPVTSKKAGRKM